MPVKVDDQMSRSVMFLCLGTAIAVVIVQWGFSQAPQPPTAQRVGIVRPHRPAPQSPSAPGKAPPSPATNTAPSPMPPVTEKTTVHLVVSLRDRQLTLYKGTEEQAQYPLAVAQAGWETPTGTFQILNMEKNPVWVHPITGEEIPPGEQNPLGVAWIGFWTDGESEIGLHGTNQEEFIGEAVSHGCLRMRNADITALYSQVTAGTTIEVKP